MKQIHLCSDCTYWDADRTDSHRGIIGCSIPSTPLPLKRSIKRSHFGTFVAACNYYQLPEEVRIVRRSW